MSNLTAETDIRKISELIYLKGPMTVNQLQEETGQNPSYLKRRLKELQDLGKVRKLEKKDLESPIYHKEFNEIDSVIQDMAGVSQ